MSGVPERAGREAPHRRGPCGVLLRDVRRSVPPWAAALVAVLLLPPPAAAQQSVEDSGRWWWDAVAGLGQVRGNNRLDGSAATRFRQSEVLLSGGINGFIVHPLLARFRLQTDLRLSNYSGSSALDTDRTGLGFDLHGLSRGAYPYRLFFRRQLFDYAAPAEDVPFSPRGLPDSGTRWGGQVRLRRGALRGVLIGLEHGTLDFLDPQSDREQREREFVQWSRRAGRLQHNVRLEHRRHDFGRVFLGTEDFTLRIDERGDITPRWWWEMTADSIDRTSFVDDRPPVETEDHRLHNRFRRSLRGDDFLDFALKLGLFRTETASTQRQDLAVLYRWRPGERWEIAPFGRYLHVGNDDVELSAPRAGLRVTWNRRLRGLDTLVSARTGWGDVARRTAEEHSEEFQLDYGFSTTVAHQHAGGLRENLEFEVARNELRFERARIIGLPDLGLPGDGLDAEDSYRMRASLDRSWNARRVHGWVEWRRSTSSVESRVIEGGRTSYTGGLDGAVGRWAFKADTGQTDVASGVGADQSLRFAGAAASWRPLRYLRVSGVYRKDRRELLFGPDVDGRWLETEAALQFGRLAFDLRLWERRNDVAEGQQRVNRGLTWNLSSRFGGLLPIVTGTRRRGVIR